MIDRIKSLAKGMFTDLQQIRRHLHMHPELSFKEHNTADFIARELATIGVPYQAGVAGTGVVALVRGRNPGKKCIALRADIDALPIQEDNDAEYKSQTPGVMHACGHDVHTTCLLGATRILCELRDTFEGTIKIIFQPGEEKSPGGASLMIAEGVLKDPEPEAIFALHVYPQLPAGTAGFRGGQYMASADEIYITVNGKGGHAALPHQTVDPIAISALIITGLQQLVSRRSNPLSPTVLTFGKIEGGSATNVIPDKVMLMGTLRTFDDRWRSEAKELIKSVAQGIASAYGAEAVIDIPPGYPPLYNDPALTGAAIGYAKEYLGEGMVRELDMRMGAEDFSFYTLSTKGCFFRIGTSNGTQFTAPVHNPHFDVDEQSILTGTGLMAYIALQALQD